MIELESHPCCILFHVKSTHYSLIEGIYKHCSILIENKNEKIIEKIKKKVKVSRKIRLDIMRDVLKMEFSDNNKKFLDWAVEFNFKFDGDFIYTQSFQNMSIGEGINFQQNKEQIKGNYVSFSVFAIVETAQSIVFSSIINGGANRIM